MGYAFPVASIDEAREKIRSLAAEHAKATHVCWAYRIFTDGQIQACQSDAGEPHHSAGPPILAAFEGRQLVNTLCIVVRYFGGTKLGIGGLIRAYGGTAAKTMDRAGRKKFPRYTIMRYRVAHSDYPNILRVIQQLRLEFRQQFRNEVVEIEVKVNDSQKATFRAALKAIPSLKKWE